jgi:hypothetical protein
MPSPQTPIFHFPRSHQLLCRSVSLKTRTIKSRLKRFRHKRGTAHLYTHHRNRSGKEENITYHTEVGSHLVIPMSNQSRLVLYCTETRSNLFGGSYSTLPAGATAATTPSNQRLSFWFRGQRSPDYCNLPNCNARPRNPMQVTSHYMTLTPANRGSEEAFILERKSRY